MKLRILITVAMFAAAMTAAFGSNLQSGHSLKTIGGEFTLLDAKSGKTFSDRDLRGRPAALFFGFTHCADVCPTALISASRWLKALGSDADKVRVVFVSVDPSATHPTRSRST